MAYVDKNRGYVSATVRFNPERNEVDARTIELLKQYPDGLSMLGTICKKLVIAYAAKGFNNPAVNPLATGNQVGQLTHLSQNLSLGHPPFPQQHPASGPQTSGQSTGNNLFGQQSTADTKPKKAPFDLSRL